MIISHKYKFIFIKTLKTAGTSIEVDLNNHLGPEDISTPIYPKVDGHIPRNYKSKFFKKDFINHMTACEVIEYIGKDIFKNYFSFCVEREPVDKCISHYSMLKNSPYHRSDKTISFNDYISDGIFPNDVAKYTSEDGKLLVDKIIKYENLKQELQDVSKIIGLDFVLQSRVKSGFRENINITKTQKKTIYKSFSDSLIYTGYKFT